MKDLIPSKHSKHLQKVQTEGSEWKHIAQFARTHKPTKARYPSCSCPPLFSESLINAKNKQIN